MNRALIDQFNSTINKANLKGRAPWAVNHLTQNVYKAKRFVFDSDASFRLGQLMHENAPLIARNMFNLKMPFEELYIEVDSMALFEGRSGHVDPTDDMRIAYTVDNGRVITLVEAMNAVQSQTEIYVAPFTFALNKEQEIPPKKIYSLDDDDLAENLKMCWVVGAQKDTKNFDKNGQLSIHLPDLEDIKSEDLAKMVDVKPIMPLESEQAYECSFMGGGVPMIFAAAVMMINERSKHTIIMEKAARRILHKGKSHAVPEHSVVSVHFDKSDCVDVRYLITSNPGKPRREHDVRGHWVYYNDNQCNHTWEPLTPDNTKQYICPSCRARKTWRHEHVRGDIALGRVDKVYSIKK